MGGRAAEMLIFNQLTTGASDDMAKATNIAREMVMRYGMSEELGFVAYAESRPAFLEVNESYNSNGFSDKTAKEIDECVKKMVMSSYNRAYDFLAEHRPLLESAARQLLDQETLNEDELHDIFMELEDHNPRANFDENHLHH